ncbi:unnamed protein product [Plutella xylostella]|uniref:(diamondback moth) hypothetical protein n=1 Tax=Plutella xylostella TaxID=51655 RepID=A0A8S4FU86_PLUXY|nr:unnamed protein product [Plutella xylostella]
MDDHSRSARHARWEANLSTKCAQSEGTSSYDTVRPLAYSEAKIFVLCFNIGEPETLHNAAAKWYREVRTHGGAAPVLLCGCKADLRHDQETLAMLAKLKMHPVTSEETKVCRSGKRTSQVSISGFWSGGGVLLCGCKADLRHDQDTLAMLAKMKMHPVTSEENLEIPEDQRLPVSVLRNPGILEDQHFPKEARHSRSPPGFREISTILKLRRKE